MSTGTRLLAAAAERDPKVKEMLLKSAKADLDSVDTRIQFGAPGSGERLFRIHVMMKKSQKAPGW